VPRVDWLLTWLRAAMPTAKLAILAMTPSQFTDVTAGNKGFRKLTQTKKHSDVMFIDCNAGLDPRSSKLYRDGTHLTDAGQRMVLKCLKKAVWQYM